MNTEDIDEAILASLKKLGPSSPSRLADDAGIAPGQITYAGVRLRKAKLIQTAGSTLNRLWALPEQTIEMADLAPPAGKKTKKAKPARKAKAARKAKRAYTKRKAAKPRRKAKAREEGEARVREEEGQARDRFRAARAAALDAEPASFEEAMRGLNDIFGGTFGRLRRAFDDHLAALTETRRRLFGATSGEAAKIERGGKYQEPERRNLARRMHEGDFTGVRAKGNGATVAR